MAVDHRQAAGIVLLADQAAGIHAEGAHLVLKGVGIIDDLGLVQIAGQVIHCLLYTSIAIGVNLDGRKEVLGMWVGENESAKFWATVLNGLKNQGVEDIFIACTDNLTGFDAAIHATFPQTEIQNCIIHQLRSSSKYVSYKDLKDVYKRQVYDEGGTISDRLEIKPIKYEGDGWQYTASEDTVTILGNVTLDGKEDLQTFLKEKEKERIDALVVQQNGSLDATGYSLDQFNGLSNAGTIKGGTFICNSAYNSGTIDGGTFGNHMINEGVIKDGVFNCPCLLYTSRCV